MPRTYAPIKLIDVSELAETLNILRHVDVSNSQDTIDCIREIATREGFDVADVELLYRYTIKLSTNLSTSCPDFGDLPQRRATVLNRCDDVLARSTVDRLCDALTSIIRNPNLAAVGICEHLRLESNVNSLLIGAVIETLARRWPKYSGTIRYPVPDPTSWLYGGPRCAAPHRAAHAYYNLPRHRGEYGRNRLELVEFLLTELDKDPTALHPQKLFSFSGHMSVLIQPLAIHTLSIDQIESVICGVAHTFQSSDGSDTDDDNEWCSGAGEFEGVLRQTVAEACAPFSTLDAWMDGQGYFLGDRHRRDVVLEWLRTQTLHHHALYHGRYTPVGQAA